MTCITFLPLYFQNLRGWTSLASAGLLTPIIGVQVFVSAAAGRWVSKKKHYAGVIRLGFAIYLVGASLMIIFDRDTHPVVCVVILLTAGTGVGMCTQAIIVALQAHTPKSQRAVILSCRNFFRFLGAACGVVVSAAALQKQLKDDLPPQYRHLADSSYYLPPLDGNDRSTVLASYRKAIRSVFIINAAMMLVTGLLCFLWKDRGLDMRPEDETSTVERPQTPMPHTEPESQSFSSTSLSASNGEKPANETGSLSGKQHIMNAAAQDVNE